MRAAEALASDVGTAPACASLDVARSSYYRWRAPRTTAPRARPTPSRALQPHERDQVLDLLHSERFVDVAPAAVYAILLDEKRYLCSTRTMYRILDDAQESKERRNQRRHPIYAKPELLATRPNEVWSWDITKLRGPVKWSYYYLYVLVDIFSRCVVGWLVAERESGALAKRLIEQTCIKQNIRPGQLSLHSDRGPSMTSKSVVQLHAQLGLTKSLSRPHVSNDNPFSESQFKTLKYRPTFPDRFGCIEDGINFCRSFFSWYNGDHRHSGIGFMTPDAVHTGRAASINRNRQQALLEAYRRHPERFVRKLPKPPTMPEKVWINPPQPCRLHAESGH